MLRPSAFLLSHFLLAPFLRAIRVRIAIAIDKVVPDPTYEAYAWLDSSGLGLVVLLRSRVS